MCVHKFVNIDDIPDEEVEGCRFVATKNLSRVPASADTVVLFTDKTTLIHELPEHIKMLTVDNGVISAKATKNLVGLLMTNSVFYEQTVDIKVKNFGFIKSTLPSRFSITAELAEIVESTGKIVVATSGELCVKNSIIDKLNAVCDTCVVNDSKGRHINCQSKTAKITASHFEHARVRGKKIYDRFQVGTNVFNTR